MTASAPAEPATDGIVAGVFPSRAHAEAAMHRLRRVGPSASDLELRAPTPGRYRLENRGSQEIGRAVAMGALLGAPTGSLSGLLLLHWTVPALATSGLVGICLAILLGGFWGAFYGGVLGLAPKVRARVDEDRWWVTSGAAAETVMIVRAGARAGAARTAMRRHGAAFFLAEIPAAGLPERAAQAA